MYDTRKKSKIIKSKQKQTPNTYDWEFLLPLALPPDLPPVILIIGFGEMDSKIK